MILCLRCASHNVGTLVGQKQGRKGDWMQCRDCGHTFLWYEPMPDSPDYVPRITSNYDQTSPSGLTLERDTEE